jgi:hypothetical protein
VGVVAVLSDDDDETARQPDRGAALDAALPPGPARDLVTLVRLGRTLAYHAVYEQSGGHRLEVWIDGPLVRQEVTPAGGDRQLLLRNEDETFECTAPAAGGDWTCGEPAETSIGIQDQLQQLVTDLEGVRVSATGKQIAGEAVQCYALDSPEAPVEICLTADGALARLAAEGEQLEVVELERGADASVFAGP